VSCLVNKMNDQDDETESTWQKMKNLLGIKPKEVVKPEARSLPPTLTREKIDAEIKAIIAKETGVERVKDVFRYE
jgi:hypothetical protein